MALVQKRAGAPAGTINVTISLGSFAIGDTPVEVASPSAYGELIAHPYFQASGAGLSFEPEPSYVPVYADVAGDELEGSVLVKTEDGYAFERQDQYLGVYFGGDDKVGTRLFLAAGSDLDRFQSYGPPVFTPTIGSQWCRDPDIELYKGRYWLAFTHGTFGEALTGFGLAHSTDLRHWTQVADISMAAITSVNRVWVDQWWYDPDGGLHLFFSATTGGDAGNFVRYETHPLNDMMTSWSAPVLCSTGLPTTTLDYSPIQAPNGTWTLFCKDNATEKIVRATSATSFLGPWTVVDTDIFDGWGIHIEASYVMANPAGGYRIFFDQYIYPPATTTYQHAKTHYSDSTDLVTWTTPVPHKNLGRHARVRSFPSADVNRLMHSSSPSFCDVRRAAVQSLTNNTILPIEWDSLPEDTDGMWSGLAGSGNPNDAPLSGGAGKWHVNIRNGGVYVVSAYGLWTAATADRYMDLTVNETIVLTQKLTNGGNVVDNAITMVTPLRLYRGDQVALRMYQNSGAAINTNTPPGIVLRLAKVGP